MGLTLDRLIRNLAWSAGTHFNVNAEEGDTAGKAVDGHVANGWSTWSAPTNIDTTAIFTFDRVRTITHVATTFYRDGRVSWPKEQALEYRVKSGVWHRLGTRTGWYLPQSGSDSSTDADTPTADFVLTSPVEAKAVRLVNILQDSRAYIDVAEIEVHGTESASTFNPEPGNANHLADLRLDGQTIGVFSSDQSGYVVDLPLGVQRNPVLQAFSRDNAASVVQQSDTQLLAGGRGLITVTPADGSRARTYSVLYRSFDLRELKITPPVKPDYDIGERFDPRGLQVGAVYVAQDTGNKQVKPLLLNDPELSITGFDSSMAGRKIVTVAYRGVNANFEVSVRDTGKKVINEDSSGSKKQHLQPDGRFYSTLAHSRTAEVLISLWVLLLTVAVVAVYMARRYWSDQR